MGKSLYYIKYNGINSNIMYNYRNYISIEKIDAPNHLFTPPNGQLNEQSPSHTRVSQKYEKWLKRPI